MTRPHAVCRLAERYGVRRNGLGVVASIKARILNGEAKFKRPLPAGRSEWEVYACGRRVRAVWDEAGKIVVTVLPARKRRRRTQ